MPRVPDDSLTHAPETDISFRAVTLDPSLAESIGKTIYLNIEQSKGDRAGLNDTIEYWRDLNEMVTEERDEPWPDAASISSGVTAQAVIDYRARLMAAVFVKTPYIVHGKTPEAAASQEEVARYYNAWFFQREVIQAHDDAIHLSILDGTSYMHVPWIKHIKYRPIYEQVPILDGEGNAIPDPKNPGKPKRKTERRIARIVEKNGVFPEAVELQDFFLCPASATSVEKALAVAHRVWLDEADLWAMVEEGILWKEAVEEVLQRVSAGYDEHAELARKSTYEMAGQVNVSGGSVGDVGDGIRQRGPFEFFMYHTREYDIDGDGNYEENVGFIHYPSQILCGIGPFEYYHGRRPYVKIIAGLPRPNREYGRGIPELTRCFDEEASAMDNQRLDLIDLLLGAPRYHKRNVNTKDRSYAWGPTADFEVEDKDDIGLLLQGYQVPVVSIQEQMQLEAKAARLVGTATPGQATLGSQKISAKQAQAWQTSQNVIIDLAAMQVRWAMKEILEQVHFLTLQYAYTDDDDSDTAGAVQSGGQQLRPTFDVLGVNGGLGYELDVTGLSGGLDQSEEYQRVMTAYAMLRQDPLVAGDMGKWWYVVNMVLQQLGRPDIPKIIGTQQDAAQKQQQMEAAQKEKEDREFQLAMINHSKAKVPAGAPGQGQNGHAQQPPQPPPQPPISAPANTV